jgi:ABC-type transport system substrate-binding protein
VETDKLTDTMVRFRLTQPLGSFLEALRIGILPYHVFQGTTARQLAAHPFNLSPIGTGAYQLEALRTAPEGGWIQTVDLRVAPVYRQREEGSTGYAIERLRFTLFDTFEGAAGALAAGEVDGLAARRWSERPALLQTAGAGNVSVRSGIEPTVGMLVFNWSAGDDFRVFSQQRVREALQAGLDRNFISVTLPNLAIRADSPLLPNSWAYADGLPWAVFDLSAAQIMLLEAQIDIGGETADATPEVTPEGETTATEEATPLPDSTNLFNFAILTPDEPALVAVAEQIAAQWSLLNIGVRVEVVDLETYRARLEGHEFHAALVELSKEGSADPDVYAFWHQGQYPDGENYGGADDRVISEILEKARREPYGLNRIAEYRRFQEQFIERAIAIPLYYPLFTYAVNGRVRGVQLGFIGAPSDRFFTLKDWTLN